MFRCAAQSRLPARVLIQAALVAIVVALGLGLAGFGLALAVQAVRLLGPRVRALRAAWRSRDWTEAEGVIIRAVVVRSGLGRRASYAAAFAYSYPAAGQTWTATRQAFDTPAHRNYGTLADARAAVAQRPKGTRVPVYFDPEQPALATLDRRPPGVFGLLALVLVLLLPAAAFLPLGWAMVRGAVTEPPRFAADELPSLAQQIGGLLLFTGSVVLLVAWVRAARTRALRPLLALLQAARPVRSTAVTADALVAVSGRAEAGSAGTGTAPGSPEPVLYHRTEAREGGITPLCDVCHCDFFVRDDSGRIQVDTEDGTDQLPPRTLAPDPALCAWVDAALADSPLPVPAQFTVVQTRIAPGDPVLVVGRARQDDDGTLVLAADQDDDAPLLFAAETLPELTQRLGRSVARPRQLALAAAATVLVGSVLLWC